MLTFEVDVLGNLNDDDSRRLAYFFSPKYLLPTTWLEPRIQETRKHHLLHFNAQIPKK